MSSNTRGEDRDGADSPPRVLVAEDNPRVAYALRRALSLLDADATFVADGVTAMSVLASETFDALICDLRMPGTKGIEVVRWAHTKRPMMRVVVVSGYADEDDRARLHEMDICLLAKPFIPPQVIEALGFPLPKVRPPR